MLLMPAFAVRHVPEPVPSSYLYKNSPKSIGLLSLHLSFDLPGDHDRSGLRIKILRAIRLSFATRAKYLAYGNLKSRLERKRTKEAIKKKGENRKSRIIASR